MQNIILLLKSFNAWSVVFRVLLSVVIGGGIGIERRRHGHAAGTRTFILVCLGAAMAAMSGLYMYDTLGLTSDPARISAQVISGIGFLGAGTIMTYHSQKTGLTTAAGLWATACIGIAIGLGFYIGVAASFAAVMVTYMILGKIGPSSKGTLTNILYVELSDVGMTNQFVEEMSSDVSVLSVVPAKSGIPQHVGLELGMDDPDPAVISRIRAFDYVSIALLYS